MLVYGSVPYTAFKRRGILRRGRHEIGGAETVNTYVQETGLTEKKPELEKIDPILFSWTTQVLAGSQQILTLN